MEGCKCFILDFENDGVGKKAITLYLDGKWVNSNQELRSGFFSDDFYRIFLVSTASVGSPIILH